VVCSERWKNNPILADGGLRYIINRADQDGASSHYKVGEISHSRACAEIQGTSPLDWLDFTETAVWRGVGLFLG
jgi:hypothetical protein